MRVARVALPLTALLAAPLALTPHAHAVPAPYAAHLPHAGPGVPAARAVQQDPAPCGFDEICFYSQPTGQGEIVYRAPLTAGWHWNENGEWRVHEIEFHDEAVIDPAFTANSARTPLPLDQDCGILVYPEEDQGGESQWVNGPLTQLALDSEIRSMAMDCG